jgi:hypothetical protein
VSHFDLPVKIPCALKKSGVRLLHDGSSYYYPCHAANR